MIDLDELEWSKPRKVGTKFGPRIVRNWVIPPNHEFWKLWRTGVPRREGYSIRKHENGVWELTEWRNIHGGSDLAQPSRQMSLGLPDVTLTGLTNDRFNEIKGNLLEFQVEHTKRLVASLERSKDALDASDTGTGKTFCSLAAVYALGLKPLIVCPKPVVPFWKKSARYMRLLFPIVINYEKIRRGTTEYGYWTTEGFHWTADNKRVVIIFDECHRLKSSTTLQVQLGLAAVRQGFHVMALSATAADNPTHMKFISYLTKQIHHPDQFYGWMVRHKVRRGYKGKGLAYAGGRKEMLKIHKLFFPEHGSRIRVADLGDRFPQTLIISEAYDMDEAGDIQAVYDEMHREIAILEERMGKDWRANVLVAQLRARQKVELLKVPTLTRMTKDGVAEGMSVAIFANFDATVTALVERLKTDAVIRGDQKHERREEFIQRFQQDKEKIIIANIKAGGVGIGLHGKAPRLGLLCPTFSAIDLKQALGRLPRAGGGYSVQKIVFAAGTIEEVACEKVREKLSRINTLNDGELAEALAI